ncbi:MULTISPECIES: ATP-binding protein [unclassified Thioalkalivibrio]|uniref:ATP-binding protein n=1 Tax=unclassified Thioalkalivibrio TaxID=2621013 RepID=UPI000371DE65|nr:MULTISPECIES: DUF87 domain-containing protein [unclassified Thioalkalivibrio]
MHFTLGVDAHAKKRGQIETVGWDFETVVNPHMLIMGMSGAGKTHTIRSIIRGMLNTSEGMTRMPRVHLFDVHGDLASPKASSARISEQSPYGLNPLKINPDPHFGGPRKQIQFFLDTINRSTRRMGDRQEACLRSILVDLYAANGFYLDKVESWKLDDGRSRKYPKKHPTLHDAQRFAYHKLKSLYLGGDNKATASLEQLNKKVAKLNRLRKPDPNGEIEPEDLDKTKAEVIDTYSQYVESITTGRELEQYIRYGSKDVLRSISDRLENLAASGIFKNETPPFDDRVPVWHYDMTAISNAEQKMFTLFRLQEVMEEAYTRGPTKDLVDIVVIDEAHRYMSGDSENIIDTIAKEGRKFGVGLMAASQSPSHFTDDFLSSVATKIILGLDEMHWSTGARKLRIDEKLMTMVIPRRRLLVQVKRSTTTQNRYHLTLPPQEQNASGVASGS